MICYMSKEYLTEDNISVEHIIPNAFGGKLKSKNLINSYWNNLFGSTIDAELVKQIRLPILLNIKRERGENPKILVKTKDGIKYLLINENQALKQQTKPIKTELPDGSIKIEFIKGQEEQILLSLKKTNPNLEIDALREQIKWDNTQKKQIVYFDNYLSLISGKNAIKAICKIACNFYVYSTNEINQIQEIVLFLKDDVEDFKRLKYYYPKKEIYKLDKNEISNLIHIEGNKTEKLLYAYIELFSCHSFFVILNNNYDGKNINFTYCYDLNNNIELKKNIRLNLSKIEIEKMNFPQDDDSENEYLKRLQRISQIKNIKLEIPIK